MQEKLIYQTQLRNHHSCNYETTAPVLTKLPLLCLQITSALPTTPLKPPPQMLTHTHASIYYPHNHYHLVFTARTTLLNPQGTKMVCFSLYVKQTISFSSSTQECSRTHTHTSYSFTVVNSSNPPVWYNPDTLINSFHVLSKHYQR